MSFVHLRWADLLSGVYLHVLADTLGSVSVIVSYEFFISSPMQYRPSSLSSHDCSQISSIFVHYWGIMIADPICSFLLSLMIFGSVIPLLKKSAATLLQTTPVVSS
jgi:zinc transporter 5/7